MEGLSKPAELLQSCTFWCMALLPHEGHLHPAGHHTGCWADMGRLKVLHPRERNDHQGRSTQADDGGGFHQTRPDFPNSVPSSPRRGKSLKKFQNLKRNGHFFHMHVMKRAVMASKDGSKSMLGKTGGTYTSFIKYFGPSTRAFSIPESPCHRGDHQPGGSARDI